jgi:hypothetical protein
LRDSSNGLGVCNDGSFVLVVAGWVCKCLGKGSHTLISIKSPTCNELVVDIAAASLRTADPVAAADTDPVLVLPVVLIVPSSSKGLAAVAATEPVPPGEVVTVAKACGGGAGTEVTEKDVPIVLLLVPKRSGCKHNGVPSKCSASCTFKETRPECRLVQPTTPVAAPAATAAVTTVVATEPVVVAVALLLLAKIWLGTRRLIIKVFGAVLLVVTIFTVVGSILSQNC